MQVNPNPREDQALPPGSPAAPPRPAAPHPAGAFGISLGRILNIVRRQLWIVVLCVLAGLAVAAYYLDGAQPLYTANARLLIEPSRTADWISSNRTITPGVSLDRGVVESQIEVLRSDNAVAEVAQALDLADRPEFEADAPGPVSRLLGQIKALVRPAPEPVLPAAASPVDRTVFNKLVGGLEVTRIEDSYVMNVGYTSADPRLSAEVANAFADTYIADLLQTRADMSKVAVDWLDGQIVTAERRVAEADAAITAFRSDHDLLATGPVNEKQLIELSTQLASARANRAAAEARLNQFRGFTAEQRQQAALPEALTNPIILGLRNQYLSSAAQLAEVERVFGSQHPDAIRLGEEMKQTDRLIVSELDRMGLSYENEVAIAQARETMIEKDFQTLRETLISADMGMATLRRLEWTANAAAETLNTLAAQRRTAAELQAHPSAEARVISPAVEPVDKSRPRETVVLLLAILAGGAVGCAIGTLREVADLGFRTPEQLQHALGVPCLGLVPNVPGKDSLKPAIREALMAAKLTLAAGGGKGRRTIGVVAALGGEGCSTVAVHLASMLSEDGSRVVLVDGGSPTARELQVLTPPAGRSPAAAPSGSETVVADFPPLAIVREALVQAQEADVLLLVTSWGKTQRSLVRELVEDSPALRAKLAGVVLNRVDFRKLPRYADAGSATYYLARQKRADARRVR